MVDAKINPINVSNREENIEIEETRKEMDIQKDETNMMDQVLDDAIKVDRAKKRLLNYHLREDTLFFKNWVC